jgi:hypothetical protein
VFTVDATGRLVAASQVPFPIATPLTLGGVIPDGSTITVTAGGVISIAPEYNVTAVPVPASSADPGTVGEIAFGPGYFYWYDGAQWLRVAGSTF